MRFKNLASSSSGNSTYIGSGNTHLLIDCGISKKKISEGLNEAQISLNDIDAILLTHEHTDHISSLGVLERTIDIPVYATKGTIDGLLAAGRSDNIDPDLFHIIKADVPFNIGDLLIKPFEISHDANEPVCFRIENGKKSAGIITDLGFYNEYLVENFKGLDIIMAEANHDIRMLETGKYPYFLKQRIAGKKGHLSNEESGRFISGILHDDLKEIILGHLSRENNYPGLAKLSVEAEIDMADNKYKRSDFKIEIAKADIPLELLEV